MNNEPKLYTPISIALDRMFDMLLTLDILSRNTYDDAYSDLLDKKYMFAYVKRNKPPKRRT